MIERIYNEFYSFKKTISTNKEVKKIPFPVDLLNKATAMLSSTVYDRLPILIEQGQNMVINPEVTIKIINKIDSGLQINHLERIIMDVGIFIARGYQIDGKVNSESDFNENLVKKRQNKITEFMKELENIQEDIHDKLEADRFEFYEWEDLGLISEKDFREYQEKLKDFEPTYYLDGYLSNSEKAIKASNNIQELIYKGELTPLQLRKRMLDTLLLNERFLDELGLKGEERRNYESILEKINEKINEGVTEDNRREISTNLNELTDADIMDIARERFGWEKYPDRNVAYFMYKIKIDGSIHTGVFFGISGAQIMPGTEIDNNGYWQKVRTEFLSEKLPPEVVGRFERYWDSERKLLIAFLDKYRNNFNEIEELDLSIASERSFCDSCEAIINTHFINLLLEECSNLKEIIFRLRNDAKKTTNMGVRDYLFLFFDIYANGDINYIRKYHSLNYIH